MRIWTSDMSRSIVPGNTQLIPVVDGIGGSTFVLDLFDDSALFRYDGGTSPYNQLATSAWYDETVTDSFVIGRPNSDGKTYSIEYDGFFDGDYFFLRNATQNYNEKHSITGSVAFMGQAGSVDNFNLGLFSPQYLGGPSDPGEVISRPATYVFSMNNILRPIAAFQVISISNNAQIVISANANSYSTFTNSAYIKGFNQQNALDPTLIASTPSSAPMINYQNSALLRGDYSFINAQFPDLPANSQLGSPVASPAEVSIKLSDRQTACSVSYTTGSPVLSPAATVSVTRGASGSNQITDQTCGIQQFQFTTDNSQNLINAN